MRKSIGVIFNPRARINKKKVPNAESGFREIFGDKALVNATENKAEIDQVIRRFHGEGVKFLLISGGDGTICNVLTSYLNLFGTDDMPVIVPLMGGTINMIGTDSGLRRNQFSVCKKLNTLLEKDEPVSVTERGMLKVNDPESDRPIYGFSWIDGLLYNFLLDYYDKGAGVQVASMMALKLILTSLSNTEDSVFREIISKVWIDSEKVPHESHVFIIASCLRKFVFGFDIYDEKSVPGRSFNVLYLRSPFLKNSRHKIPLGLYKGIRSDGTGDFINSTAAELVVDENRGYIIDGEIFRREKPTRVSIKPGPALRIFTFKGEKALKVA